MCLARSAGLQGQELMFALDRMAQSLPGAHDGWQRLGFALILFGLVFSALSTLALGTANRFEMLYPLAVVIGLLSDIAGPAHSAMIADILPEKQRQEAVSQRQQADKQRALAMDALAEAEARLADAYAMRARIALDDGLYNEALCFAAESLQLSGGKVLIRD